MARLPGFAQGVVAFDVGLRFGGERQSIRRLHLLVGRLACRRSIGAARSEYASSSARQSPNASSTAVSTACLGLLLEDESQNLYHSAVAARRLLSMRCCRARKAGGSSDERRAIAQGCRLALNDRQIVARQS